MAACGGGKSALAGTWYLIEGRGENIPLKCELLRDGTGFALDQAVTWKTENNRLYIIHPYLAMAFNYKLSGSLLNLSNDKDQKFVYTKELGGTSAIVGTWFALEGVGQRDFELLKDGTGTGITWDGKFIWKTENNRLYNPAFGLSVNYKISGAKLTLSNDNGREFVYMKNLGGNSAIVGTWTDIENIKWTFGADGKLTYENRQDDIREYNYVTDGKKLAIHLREGVQSYDISISADGKTSELTGGEDLSGWRVAGPGWSENSLKK